MDHGPASPRGSRDKPNVTAVGRSRLRRVATHRSGVTGRGYEFDHVRTPRADFHLGPSQPLLRLSESGPEYIFDFFGFMIRPSQGWREPGALASSPRTRRTLGGGLSRFTGRGLKVRAPGDRNSMESSQFISGQPLTNLSRQGLVATAAELERFSADIWGFCACMAASRRPSAGIGQTCSLVCPVPRRTYYPATTWCRVGRQRWIAGAGVVHFLIAQRDPEHTLPDQRLRTMSHTTRLSTIHEARRKAINQTNRPVRRPQQQRPRVQSHHTTVETRHHTPAFDTGKHQRFRYTLCRHRGTLLGRDNSLVSKELRNE